MRRVLYNLHFSREVDRKSEEKTWGVPALYFDQNLAASYLSNLSESSFPQFFVSNLPISPICLFFWLETSNNFFSSSFELPLRVTTFTPLNSSGNYLTVLIKAIHVAIHQFVFSPRLTLCLSHCLLFSLMAKTIYCCTSLSSKRRNVHFANWLEKLVLICRLCLNKNLISWQWWRRASDIGHSPINFFKCLINVGWAGQNVRFTFVRKGHWRE